MVIKNLETRYANLGDSEILFEWQNDPTTRKYFRNPQKPSAKEHLNWIQRTLADDNISLLVVESDGIPIGVLRFDEKLDATLEISILVAPEHRNKGIGSALLALAREIRPLATLLADVKPDNTASNIIFTNAGYKPQNDLLVSSSPFNSPRIAMCPDGSQGSGLGHVRRSMGLAKKLSEVGNLPLFFLNSNSVHLKSVSDHGFTVAEYNGSFEELLNVTQGAEILILDSYQIDPMKIVNKKKSSTTVVVFDDLGIPYKFADIIVNGSPAAQNLYYKSEIWQTVLFGPKYQIIRDDIQQVPENKDILEPTNLLVCLGSGDPHNMIPSLIRILKDLITLNAKLKIDFVIGPETTFPEDVGLPNINFVKAADLPQKLITADIALVGGGQTLIEVVYSGVPCIAICLATNQIKNINSLIKLRCISDFVCWDEADWEQKLSRNLKLLYSDKNQRSRLNDVCLKLFDSRGAHRIVDVILEQHMLKKKI